MNRWKPIIGQKYYCFDDGGIQRRDTWMDTGADRKRHAFGNCFARMKECKLYLRKINWILKRRL